MINFVEGDKEIIWIPLEIKWRKIPFLYIKIKQSHYRPGEAQKFPEDWGFEISWQSAHEGG